MTEAEARSAVVAEAMSWLHTPYHHHARLKRVGVDCAQILCAIFEACGLVDQIETGYYATDWHLHRSEEVYEQWVARFSSRVQAPRPGDVALFKFGRCFSHGAVVVDGGLLLHAYVQRGVVLNRIDEDPLHGRDVRYWSVWA